MHKAEMLWVNYKYNLSGFIEFDDGHLNMHLKMKLNSKEVEALKVKKTLLLWQILHLLKI